MINRKALCKCFSVLDLKGYIISERIYKAAILLTSFTHGCLILCKELCELELQRIKKLQENIFRNFVTFEYQNALIEVS
jgi:hypothetical protein